MSIVFENKVIKKKQPYLLHGKYFWRIVDI